MTKTSSKHKSIAIYTRLSVERADGASVSLDRQREACEAWALANGYTVAGHYSDTVSGAVKPEKRPGWRAMVASKPDAVVCWKLDRIGRMRITTFWDTYQRLEADGIALVSVTENLNGDSTIGRALMGLIMSFAEMERDAISARVTDARRYLLNNGRVPGGRVSWPWMTVPNPDGKGFVLARNPATFPLLEMAIERTQAGRSIYSTVQALAEAGQTVSYAGLERLLRNPLCAGMVPYTTGNSTKERGSDVVRGGDGLPVVYADLAAMPVTAWRAMVKALDERDSAQARPSALRAKTSGALSGLVLCGDDSHAEPVRMWRGTAQGRHGMYCPECHQTLTNFEPLLIAEFLRQKGERVMWTPVTTVEEGGAEAVAALTLRIRELRDEQDEAEASDDTAQVAALEKEIKGLQARRREMRDLPPTTRIVMEDAGFFAEAWEAADDDETRRDILGRAIERIFVRRGKPGRRTDAQLLARLDIEWKMPEDLGPVADPTAEDLVILRPWHS